MKGAPCVLADLLELVEIIDGSFLMDFWWMLAYTLSGYVRNEQIIILLNEQITIPH